MPSPKSKHSKSRRDKRRANWKLTVPGLVECPQCHAMKLPHHVCPVFGFYKGSIDRRIILHNNTFHVQWSVFFMHNG